VASSCAQRASTAVGLLRPVWKTSRRLRIRSYSGKSLLLYELSAHAVFEAGSSRTPKRWRRAIRAFSSLGSRLRAACRLWSRAQPFTRSSSTAAVFPRQVCSRRLLLNPPSRNASHHLLVSLGPTKSFQAHSMARDYLLAHRSALRPLTVEIFESVVAKHAS